jgi:hypothetical protein
MKHAHQGKSQPLARAECIEVAARSEIDPREYYPPISVMNIVRGFFRRMKSAAMLGESWRPETFTVPSQKGTSPPSSPWVSPGNGVV